MFAENCEADGFVKTGRKGRIFHSGGRGMLRVGIKQTKPKNMLKPLFSPEMSAVY